MDKKTRGAWIIHHCDKLGSIKTSTGDYEQIDFAGKCGMLLSSLAASDDVRIKKSKVNALAKASGINTRLELPIILEELKGENLIDLGEDEISILGLTTSETLRHTAEIYKGLRPSKPEKASIIVSEMASDRPISVKEAKEFISDNYHIVSTESHELIAQFSDIGFVDSENIGDDEVIFNGNLFRRDEIKKINAVISSLNSSEERKVKDLFDRLDVTGCISIDTVKRIVGETVLKKLVSIGFIDINTIGNEKGTYSFVTRPAAFKKFSNALIDDAFDLAKAFVTSLTFGMTKSPGSRGRIKMIEALMNKLIQGYWVGPATAIGQDYKILELKGVIEVRPAHGGMFNMKLLKKDVGEIALKVVSEGEASTSMITQIPTASVTKYTGPEFNRSAIRKRQTQPLKRSIGDLLHVLRTGAIK